MTEWDTDKLVEWDKRFVWHPFTDMRECRAAVFASEHESVVSDMMVLCKGLPGGYLPLAITLISEKLFSAFTGSVAEGKALAYGHSYTGNAPGCAAAKASLEVFEKESVLEALQPKIRDLSSALAGLRELPGVKEVRQCGFLRE